MIEEAAEGRRTSTTRVKTGQAEKKTAQDQDVRPQHLVQQVSILAAHVAAESLQASPLPLSAPFAIVLTFVLWSVDCPPPWPEVREALCRVFRAWKRKKRLGVG